jgi:chromate reductase, NAD(P)H dehydrogenase (quinone)
MAVRDVTVIVGSLRWESLNRKMAKTMIELEPSSLGPEIVEIGDLPLYNEDLETKLPPA